MTYKEVDGIDENGKACKFKVEIPMKKYIRTKDGIYEWDKMIIPPRMNKSIFDRIIDQADTIEELCDEFILVRENHHYVFNELQKAFLDKFKFEENDILYGAVWTDKGLIYVAKMNEKGELELL